MFKFYQDKTRSKRYRFRCKEPLAGPLAGPRERALGSDGASPPAKQDHATLFCGEDGFILTDNKTQLGYIGLGIMGLPMARNLMDAGYPMLVWNRTPGKAQALEEAGAVIADSPADLAARGPRVIFINVTDTPDVEAILFGEHGLASAAKSGTIIVDHSTISPDATRDFAKRLAQQGIELIDAPVSGGDVGAQQGSLSIMVGGRDEAVQAVTPMLEVVGKSVVHLGEAGLGQACKACNQVAGMVTLLGVIEAMALAKKSGLDLDKMIQVVGGGAAGSWQISNLGPKIAAGDHDPGFMIDLVNKDLAIVLDSAKRASLPLEGTARIADLFRRVAADGGGRLGTQAVAKAIESAGDFTFHD